MSGKACSLEQLSGRTRTILSRLTRGTFKASLCASLGVSRAEDPNAAFIHMTDSAENGAPAPADRMALRVRVFVDGDGTRWQVSERPFADYDRRRGLSLIFASDSAVRRVREYPTNWFSLSDEELQL